MQKRWAMLAADRPPGQAEDIPDAGPQRLQQFTMNEHALSEKREYMQKRVWLREGTTNCSHLCPLLNIYA